MALKIHKLIDNTLEKCCAKFNEFSTHSFETMPHYKLCNFFGPLDIDEHCHYVSV